MNPEQTGFAIGSVIALGFVILQLLILKYLFDLEKIGCACAMDWRRSYAMFYLAFSVLLSVLFLFVGRNQLMGLRMFMMILGVIYVISVLQYVHRLKKEKCECSQSAYREVMYIVAIIQAFILGLTVIGVIVGLFVLMSVLRSAKGTNGKSAMSVRKVKK